MNAGPTAPASGSCPAGLERGGCGAETARPARLLDLPRPADRQRIGRELDSANEEIKKRQTGRNQRGQFEGQQKEAGAQQQEPTPAALHAKGIDDQDSRQLTYTGPAEDGSAEVQRNGGGKHAAPAAGSTRKERREAARKQAKDGSRTLRRG